MSWSDLFLVPYGHSIKAEQITKQQILKSLVIGISHQHTLE